MYVVYVRFTWQGKSSNIRSYMVFIYGSGQHYMYVFFSAWDAACGWTLYIHTHRVGQNRTHTVYDRRFWKIPCHKNTVYTVYTRFWPILHIHAWFWPTLCTQSYIFMHNSGQPYVQNVNIVRVVPRLSHLSLSSTWLDSLQGGRTCTLPTSWRAILAIYVGLARTIYIIMYIYTMCIR
jgi:hypothetical protein